jgi:hypothetical protein
VLQVETEELDGTVCNLHLCEGRGVAAGGAVERGGERVSLTIRRVLKVLKNVLMRL